MMYWTDTEAMKIYSAFLDGTEVTELVTSRLSIPGETTYFARNPPFVISYQSLPI